MHTANTTTQADNRNFWRGPTIRLRNMLYTNGQYFDELYFGVTVAEWDQLDPAPPLQRFRARNEPDLNLESWA